MPAHRFDFGEFGHPDTSMTFFRDTLLDR
jgi:hypothetical protein